MSSEASTIDIARARRETPGCERAIHFNNAGAALVPSPVRDAVIEYLRREALEGGYELAEREQATLAHTYDAAARLLNCQREEIAVVENATRAWGTAFHSLQFERGDRILTGRTEYASNAIALLQATQRQGVVVEVLPNDETGQISLDALRNALDSHVKLIALTHVGTHSGLVNPAAEVGKIAREAGVLYLLDACQSVGQMPIDVQTLGCDMLSATGRKFLRAPRGTGLLYVRRDVMERLEPIFLDLHAAEWVAHDRYTLQPDARRFETWESNLACKVGLGVAIDYALELGLDAIYARITFLADLLRQRLRQIPGVTVQDIGRELCGIVTFTMEGREPPEIRARLSEQNIHLWVSGQSSARYDLEARHLTQVARASVHYYNTEDEIARFGAALQALTARPSP